MTSAPITNYRIGAPVRLLPVDSKRELHGILCRTEDWHGIDMPVIRSTHGKLFRGYECWWTYKDKMTEQRK